MLLERAEVSAYEAVKRLAGMQSQVPNSPFVGLWSRVEGFKPEHLVQLYLDRQVVRISLQRSTIHLVTAEHCLAFRRLVDDVGERGLQASFGKQLKDIDRGVVGEVGRRMVEEKPMTFADLGAALQEKWPDTPSLALAMTVRTRVPLVQVPPRGLWKSGGRATHTSAEQWLGRPLAEDTPLEAMVVPFIAAYGPVSVQDAQMWSGVQRLGETFERLRPELVTFRDEKGRELFDLPDAPRPGEDAPAPVRFLPEYDNSIISLADRERILGGADYRRIFTTNGIVYASFLLDGFVGGVWKVVKEKKAIRLVVMPFQKLTTKDRRAIEKEGAKLAAFLAEGLTASVEIEASSQQK